MLNTRQNLRKRRETQGLRAGVRSAQEKLTARERTAYQGEQVAQKKMRGHSKTTFNRIALLSRILENMVMSKTKSILGNSLLRWTKEEDQTLLKEDSSNKHTNNIDELIIFKIRLKITDFKELGFWGFGDLNMVDIIKKIRYMQIMMNSTHLNSE